MLCWILIVGGLLIMMGQDDRSEALFYYFRLEDQVPEIHLLRLVEKHISFVFVRERLKQSYSETGRPSIDPELLLRILLIFIYSAPGFEEYMRCTSAPAGEPPPQLSQEELRACARKGDVEYESLSGPARK